MKLISSLLILLTSTHLYTCYNDGENPSPDLPSITTDPAEVNIDPFQQANTTVIASAPAGIKSIQKSDYDKEVQSRQNIEIIEISTGITDTTYNFTSLLTVKSLVGLDLAAEFIITDQLNQTDTTLFDVNLNEPEWTSTAPITLVPVEQGNSQTQSFFSTSLEGYIYSAGEVSTIQSGAEEVDFGFYYNPEGLASLASPNSFPVANIGIDSWYKKNRTQIKNVSSYITDTEFETLEWREVFLRFFREFPANPYVLEGFQEGDILGFNLDSQKQGMLCFGLIKVVSISNDGSMEIIVRYEEPYPGEVL